MEWLSSALEYLRGANLAATAFRLFLAMLFGGIIGLERGRRRRPAGFRTHILVCMGAALAMSISCLSPPDIFKHPLSLSFDIPSLSKAADALSLSFSPGTENRPI